jgi:hypothetical protein
MRISTKINSWLHRLMIRYVMRAYAKKSRLVEKKHPELFCHVDEKLSREHRRLWSRLGVQSGDRWLRLHVNLTGIQDYTFCPEDIFFTRIERVLNDCDAAGHGPDDKSELFHFVPKENRPDTVLRYVRGNFFDGDNKWLSRDLAAKALVGELVGKPCRSSGGNGVVLHDNFSVDWIERNGGEAYEVQRKIVQCDFTAQFNNGSVNTIRMMTMRCPWNGEIVVCRSMLRMGVCDAVIDNMMKGGLCVCVGDKGQLGKYAYDYNGKRFEMHPVSGLTFEGMRHPGYEKMVETAFAIHKNILSYNLLSFDLVQRDDGTICVIEINATSQGITQLQYDFGGLFGEYTEKVVEWCADHLELDRFSHFRTWY